MTCSLNSLPEHAIGDTTARFLTDDEGKVGLSLYPTELAGRLASRRATVANENWVCDKGAVRAAIKTEPLVHVKISGDDQLLSLAPAVHSRALLLSADSGLSATDAILIWCLQALAMIQGANRASPAGRS